MAPARKRENRENQYYNVGVQGRKTGITLEDKGVRDEYGLEPLSGVFSSPEKSPPKRDASSRSTRGTVIESESMELQESSLPDLTTSAHILRNSRTHLPPPRSRSPMKTALNSSPRRHSSIAPRAQSIGRSSPLHAVSQAVSRVLDFEQDESSLQDTPALSGSGQRRGKRPDIYDIEVSPSRQQSATLEESLIQTEISAMDGAAEETLFAQIGDESLAGIEATEASMEESEVTSEPVRAPATRGRKRKSEVLEPAAEEEPSATKTKKQASASGRGRGGRRGGRTSIGQARRSKRVSDMTNQDISVVTDVSVDTPEEVEEPPPSLPKPRGRPKGKKEAPKSAPKPAPVAKEKAGDPVFKKPKPIAKPKAATKKSTATDDTSKESQSGSTGAETESGKLVDVYGNPLSKAEIDQMSTTSGGSRFGRGRHLSVFRELDPDAIARVGRTGRHRVAPIDFWKNDRITYNHDGSMNSIVKNEDVEPQRRTGRGASRKGKKRGGLKSIDEEEEVELEPWEENEGVFIGNFKEFDAVNEVTTSTLMEGAIAWAEKGVNPVDVPDASFRFCKVGSAGEDSFLSWGFIELLPDHMKRSKNSRKMHMVFHIQDGTVEVKVHENELIVHKGGVWQVPRGNTYSIRNVGTNTARIFFAQGFETGVEMQE